MPRRVTPRPDSTWAHSRRRCNRSTFSGGTARQLPPRSSSCGAISRESGSTTTLRGRSSW
jgi:hypothetical protein